MIRQIVLGGLLLCGGIAFGQEVIADDYASSNNSYQSAFTSPKKRHNNGLNILFADSHTANLSKLVFLQKDADSEKVLRWGH